MVESLFHKQNLWQKVKQKITKTLKNLTKDISFSTLLKGKLQAIAILFKLRLATFVVFSSVVGLLIASSFTATILDVVIISIAGFWLLELQML